MQIARNWTYLETQEYPSIYWLIWYSFWHTSKPWKRCILDSRTTFWCQQIRPGLNLPFLKVAARIKPIHNLLSSLLHAHTSFQPCILLSLHLFCAVYSVRCCTKSAYQCQKAIVRWPLDFIQHKKATISLESARQPKKARKGRHELAGTNKEHTEFLSLAETAPP